MATMYEIRVVGHLEPCWMAWFEEMQQIQLPDGDTLLCGPVADQAALHGLLARIRDLNLPLVAVVRRDEQAIERRE